MNPANVNIDKAALIRRIPIFADLPARTGLGSSSSFTVGLLNALYALEGKMVSKQRLAEDPALRKKVTL